MSISKSLLPEFEHEMANTRKTLERIPEDKFGWKPHEKSTTMGALGSHLANLPSWASLSLHQDSFDMHPPGGEPARTKEAQTLAEMLETFDKNLANAREAITGASDEQFQQPWALLSGGREIFKLPRIAVLRSFVMNHTIHHRAQLGVYLRLNDVPVPSIYGPSADEGSL